MRKQINAILCATDFSDFAKDVVAYGTTLAKEFSAKLYICHVVDLTAIASYGETVTGPIEYQDRFLGYAKREIERLVSDNSVEYEPVVTFGNASEEIARLSKDHSADLVITATHGRSGLKRFFLGSVAARLMKILSCPLLILKGTAAGSIDSEHKRFPYKRILVGCDFSKDSIHAFNCTLSLAQEFESELHLVHVIEPSGYKDLFELASEPQEKLKKELFDMVEKKLNSMVPDDALSWITLKTKLMVGKPYEEIVRYAEMNDIDLIAVGTRGQGMVEELLVGSTTDRVVRRAPCPVLSLSSKAV